MPAPELLVVDPMAAFHFRRGSTFRMAGAAWAARPACACGGAGQAEPAKREGSRIFIEHARKVLEYGAARTQVWLRRVHQGPASRVPGATVAARGSAAPGPGRAPAGSGPATGGCLSIQREVLAGRQETVGLDVGQDARDRSHRGPLGCRCPRPPHRLSSCGLLGGCATVWLARRRSRCTCRCAGRCSYIEGSPRGPRRWDEWRNAISRHESPAARADRRLDPRVVLVHRSSDLRGD